MSYKSQASIGSPVLDSWLRQNLVHVDGIQVVTDRPWAQTFQVASGGEQYFLKVLPQSQRASLQATQLLSHQHSPTVPEVVACDSGNGWLLLRHHGGLDLGSSSSLEQQVNILRTYAKLQAGSVSNSNLIDALPKLSTSTLFQQFLDFLNPSASLQQGVGASHFIGEDDARGFFQRISLGAEVLEHLMSAATRLKPTINHSDLRSKNTSELPNGNCVIFDWDEAIAGPAGMSLHHFFSGCSILMEILQGKDLFAERRHYRLLECYMGELVSGGYASEAELRNALPGAAIAGVMRFVTSYAAYPMENKVDRDLVAKVIRRRLLDLIEIPCITALNSRESVLNAVEQFGASGVGDRQQSVLYRFLKQHPEDAGMQSIYAQSLLADNQTELAINTCQEALASEPLHPGLRALLGRIYMNELNLQAAIDQLRIASCQCRDNEEYHRLLSEAESLLKMEVAAAASGTVPAIRLSEEEIAKQTITKAKTRLAASLFKKYGVLLIENAFNTNLIDSLATAFHDRYRAELVTEGPAGALQVGDRRFMMTVEVSEQFNHPDIYAQPLMLPILETILGDDLILGSYTSVASFPGARDMRMHKDHPALFPDSNDNERLPHFAVTMLVPLLGYNAELGATRVIKGSHLCSSTKAAEMEYQDPAGSVGACMLMDYRLSHQGLANRSDKVRPVLSLVYNRPWFRDAVNYQDQPPLQISTTEFTRVPKNLQRLFAWAQQKPIAAISNR